jgi:heme/copper-type cytochrome/quinol oxidase subunit 3
MNAEPAPPARVVGDLAYLPTSASGARHVVWWGNIGFMLIEGTGFLLAIGAYLYLQGRSSAWPPPGDALPGLWWSGIFTAGLLLSAIPNLWVLRASRAHREGEVRVGVLVMTIVGLLLAVARWFELQWLGVRWDQDAYGSVVWLLMVLHTSHVVTDPGDTAVQAVWLYTHEVGPDQFADVEDNSNYWSFVVVAWLPIYLLIYWLPRWT